MKFASFIILSLLTTACSRKSVCSEYGEAKKLTYDNKGNIICGRGVEIPIGYVKLKDNLLNYVFILDSSHTYISAYDSIGNLVWKAEPEFENVVGERINGHIDNIYFRRSWQTNPYKVLWVRSGRRGGFFDLKTGKFRLMQI
jgi:hypothetical protein